MNTTFTDGLVTIIMPTYNSAAFIGEAIASVIHQTYTNWELLVVDDGSTANSPDIVIEYATHDPRIHLFLNDHHTGMPSSPRNYALHQAHGRYIAFLDSDDIWLPEKLSEQIPLFSDPNVAVVYSDYEKISSSGQRRGRVVKAPQTATYRRLLYGNVIGNLTGIYERQKVGTVEILDIHHEDYAMWLNILKRGFLAKNTGTVTALYRVHDTSVSSKKLSIISWQWNIYRNIEHLSLPYSCLCYASYALRAIWKTWI